MGLRQKIKPYIQDRVMRFMNELRPETVSLARGDVLEIGFGTGLNLEHYGGDVDSVTGVDPMRTEGVSAIDRRIEAAAFPVERTALRADGQLPFDEGRFDSVLMTWTLCSIPDPSAALAEIKRVTKPSGTLLFVEHGRSSRRRTAKWQDRLNPLWNKVADGCNLNRPIDALVERAGFELTALERFQHKGPSILAHMYRGIATPA